jgi:trimeric autotransporter adhesin
MRSLKTFGVLAILTIAFGISAIAQNVNVNPGAGTYATLADAFAAINSGTHTGAVTIDVIGDTAEPATGAILNASGAGLANYTSIVMTPTGARTISGLSTVPLVDFNGADNVTIDGLNAAGNSLTISNTAALATSGLSTIRFIGGATANRITNATILGSGSMAVTTNGGVIYFATDAVTTAGNDNNTISNNNIGPAGVGLPTKGIFGNGSTTTTAIGNSGIVIDNNNIFDYFGAAVTSSGITTQSGCNTWTITNNRLYQTGTRTWTTGATHRAIDINNSTGTSGAQGFTITGNIIGYSSNTQTGISTYTGSTGKVVGIFFSGITGSTVSNINNNTIAAITLSGVTSSGTGTTATPLSGIIIGNGIVNTNNNTIGSQSATGSLSLTTTTTTATDIYGIYNFSLDDWTANGNNIGGISATNLGASGTFIIYGLRANTSATKVMNTTANNVGGTIANSIQLTATGVSSQIIGMISNNAIANFTLNNIRNLTTNIGTGTTNAASVIGISSTSSTPNHRYSIYWWDCEYSPTKFNHRIICTDDKYTSRG